MMSKTSDYSAFPPLARISLMHMGYRTPQIATVLAHEGFRSPRHGEPFTPEAIRTLRRRLGLSTHPARRPPGLPKHEWGIAELARTLAISPSTVYLWRKHGAVHARWDLACKRWVVWADDAELDRLKAYSRQSVGDKHRQEWLDAHPGLAPRVLQSTTL